MKNMYTKILAQLNRSNSIVLASIIKSSGSTPRGIGAKMAYFSDGTTIGTVGGGAIEYDCTKECKAMMNSKQAFCKSYTLNHNDAADIGMVCGGECTVYFQHIDANDAKNIELFSYICEKIEHGIPTWLVTKVVDNKTALGVYTHTNGLQFLKTDSDIAHLIKNKAVYDSVLSLYIEPLTQSGVVYIFGGGHVSQALVPMLIATDFEVVVYENNEKFADKSLFEGAKDVVLSDFLSINETVNITQNDYVVILTRGHKSDNEVLRQVMSKHPSYLGVIGSRKKVAAMQKFLSECGFDNDEIKRIHSPIGIEIGAETPSEIAVSITAQIIQHRADNR